MHDVDKISFKEASVETDIQMYKLIHRDPISDHIIIIKYKLVPIYLLKKKPWYIFLPIKYSKLFIGKEKKWTDQMFYATEKTDLIYSPQLLLLVE
jgi:hypothetical protein